ncbi:hypothetical protein [uncultured virus]|uniref:Uncharacterized protein n=1 Tax=uncultured virus TaxID=340016 RepID=A0A218MKV3_9VIRU|nr:hypothetical protein [uncultured virus]|tara:strand:+ start:2510 stop:3004 length:495 start_codon:yes stop_codon:yes gene_type:complete
MRDVDQVSLSRPVPGQSLTHEVRARPWQNPPQFNTVEESMDWYLERFNNPDLVQEILAIIESGVPISTIANSMQLGAVLQGVHSIDVGVLIVPIIMEILRTLAEKTDTKYVIGDEPEETDRPSDAVLDSALNKIKSVEVEDMPEEEQVEEDVDEEPMGLMARRA